MKIDNRIFIVPLAPFVLWLWLLAFLAFTGIEPSEESLHGLAFLCVISGLMVGVGITVAAFDHEISLGSFTIGRSKDAGE